MYDPWPLHSAVPCSTAAEIAKRLRVARSTAGEINLTVKSVQCLNNQSPESEAKTLMLDAAHVKVEFKTDEG